MNFWQKIDPFDEILSSKLRIEDKNSLRFGIAAFLAHSGDSWICCGILFVFWIFASGEREKILAWWGGSIALTALAVFFLKRLIARTRPKGDWGDVYRRTDPYSFPSGHAVRAGLIIILAINTFHDPRIIAVFLLWAVMMMLSRVAAGVHYVFDILGGFLFGLLIGCGWMALQPWFFRTFPILFDKASWFK